MKASLPSVLIRLGFFVAFGLYLLVFGFAGGFGHHPILRGALVLWAAAAVLTYLVDAIVQWRSLAS